LIDASRQAGMAEVATGVLHNVGNVLNSVNTAASLALEKLKTSQVADLTKVVALIDAHRNDLGTFIAADPQGQHLPPFLRHLTQHLLDERETLLEHIQMASDKVEHVKEIVAMQQSHAMGASTIESLSLATLMEDALNTNDESFRRYQVEVAREYAELPLIMTDRHKVLQILINLVSNAKHALLAADSAPKQLTARVGTNDAEQVVLEVADNGVGIAAADLTRIFQYGFTTKAGGHGFGLHSSALMAQELGGSLTVHSDGLGRGAVFRLELPMQEARSCTV
jgi:signal transduction histidine kinase